MPTFRSINVSGKLSDDLGRLRGLTRLSFGSAASRASTVRRRLTDVSDETASRLLLQTYLEDSGDPAMVEATAPQSPELIPDLQLRGVAEAPALNARSLTYQQSASSIPVFGGRIVVDIDANSKALVSINGRLAPMPDKSPLATLSAEGSWAQLVKWAGAQPAPAAPPSAPILTWFLDEAEQAWHLTYHFSAVPIVPPEIAKSADADGQHLACVRPCFHATALYDYFVDAQSGDVVFYFSSTATLDVPIPMVGADYANVQRQFYGLGSPGAYFLIDPLRNIETYDYNYQDLDAQPPFPTKPISCPTVTLAASPQAVLAHYHAQLVFDFYNNELKRDGIDDKGMKLISVVNVYSSNQNPLPKPQWGNALWWQGKMWYGEENGQSFAKYLDVIAHELTHGVTETSSALIYRGLTGALNESYSDIFGIIIANWYPSAPNPIGTWNWQIGAGLAANGGAIRDFANPAAAGQPDHMNQYVALPMGNDQGGVHRYSGIHNKAVHNLLTEVDARGQPAFPTRELVLLLYLTLTRLTRMSAFGDSRRTLESVTQSYYAADPLTCSARLASIARAFDAVGIR